MQGKTDKQKEDSALFAAIGIVGVFLLIVFLVISSNCSGQEIGYHVVTVDYSAPTLKGEKLQTEHPEKVNEIFNKYFELDCFSIVYETKDTRSFQLENEKVWVYCEERRIVRKNGKVKYKRIREPKVIHLADEHKTGNTPAKDN